MDRHRRDAAEDVEEETEEEEEYGAVTGVLAEFRACNPEQGAYEQAAHALEDHADVLPLQSPMPPLYQ